MAFDFRVRFNFAPSFRLQVDTHDAPLIDEPHGVSIKVAAGASGQNLKDAERVVIRGGPFLTEEEAKAAGHRARSAILRWAIEQRAGVDLGNGMSLGIATTEGLRQLSEEHGVPVRNDFHGVDAFPSGVGTKFVHVSAQGVAGKNKENFASSFQRNYLTTDAFDERFVVAAELYLSSWFDISPRSRFITLMTAYEAVLSPRPRDPEARAVVGQLIAIVNSSDIPKSTKDSFRGSISWLTSESISQTGRRTAQELLPAEVFGGLGAGTFFLRAYNVRSKIVHNGLAAPQLTWEIANQMEEFVGKVLQAAIDRPEAPKCLSAFARLRQKLRAAWLAFEEG